MHHITLSDALFQDAQRRAIEVGFASVDEYVAEVLTHELQAETPDLEHFFTPARLAEIDSADADIEAGKFYSNEQAQAELSKRRAAWLLQNPRAE